MYNIPGNTTSIEYNTNNITCVKWKQATMQKMFKLKFSMGMSMIRKHHFCSSILFSILSNLCSRLFNLISCKLMGSFTSLKTYVYILQILLFYLYVCNVNIFIYGLEYPSIQSVRPTRNICCSLLLQLWVEALTTYQ